MSRDNPYRKINNRSVVERGTKDTAKDALRVSIDDWHDLVNDDNLRLLEHDPRETYQLEIR